MNEYELKQRTKKFALRIIRLVHALPKVSEGEVIGNQLLRCGISVGANYRAACRGRSKAEFTAKLGIVEEEADESVFWLEIIIESGLMKREFVWPLLKEANEIVAIMVASRKLSNQKSKIKNQKSQSGFTVLEIIVCFFVIAIGLIGILSLIVQNVQVQYINRNTLIASQLAQESLELVRNIRDNNWLAGANWKIGSGPGSGTDIIQDNQYAIDYLGIFETIADVDDINDPKAKLYIDSSGLYRHYDSPGNATTTPFSRLITVTNETAASTTISSMVQWKEKSNTYDYVAETVLYDWR